MTEIVIGSAATGGTTNEGNIVVLHVFEITFFVGILVAANRDRGSGPPEIKNFVVDWGSKEKIELLGKI
jgi:hypothetical protein